jgi:lysophospholipase L1-like esterase
MNTTIKNEHRYGKDATGILERTNEGAGVYAARCVEMGQLIQVPVLDLWTLMQQESDWTSFLSDGLHLTPKGTVTSNVGIGCLNVGVVSECFGS